MSGDFNKDLENLLKEIDIEINAEHINKFKKYMDLLIEWNKKINLTAIVEQNEIIIKHFVDSLTISKYIDRGSKVVDIGTGAGFPGIPLSIINNNTDFKLVDSLNKRIIFLDEIVKELGLSNVENIHSRAEDFGHNKLYREQFDYAVSRAVANLSTLVEYLIPTVKVGGKIICMKGFEIEEELNNAKTAIKKLGGEVVEVVDFNLPETDFKRNVVIIEKKHNTAKEYPRKAGIPSKKPLI